MGDLFCEVIGCPHCAAWRRVRGECGEEYLCRRHRQWYVALHPDRADEFIPIEELAPRLDEEEGDSQEDACLC